MAKAAMARGRLVGSDVLVNDETQAKRLHAKGTVGILVDGALRLRLVEAAWLASEGKLIVNADGRELGPSELLGLGGRDARTEVGFLAYSDLRSRGLVVRPWKTGWAVWPRGVAAQGEPEYVVAVHAERDSVTTQAMLEWARAEAVMALVDEDGAVTYYRAAKGSPAGTCPTAALPRAAGTILSDRVIITGPQAEEWHATEFLGVATGAGLVLSFTEAESLRRRGLLDVPADLAARASKVQPHFLRTLPAYEALRAAGVVAKSGFKFGTHLRGYRNDPDASHAQWLIHCTLPDERLPWAELSRAIRVAHGVRKSFLLAVATEPLAFVQLSWFKP